MNYIKIYKLFIFIYSINYISYNYSKKKKKFEFLKSTLRRFYYSESNSDSNNIQ